MRYFGASGLFGDAGCAAGGAAGDAWFTTSRSSDIEDDREVTGETLLDFP